MSYFAKIKIDGKEMSVTKFNFTLFRDVDAKGRPSSGIYGGTVQIQVESTGDTGLVESMVNNQYKPHSGSVTFNNPTSDGTMKELKFEDAYVVQYGENLTVIDKNPMTETFTLSARKLTMGSAEHVNDWPGTK